MKRCQFFRNDDGCKWCELGFVAQSNEQGTDCKKSCKERIEIKKINKNENS